MTVGDDINELEQRIDKVCLHSPSLIKVSHLPNI